MLELTQILRGGAARGEISAGRESPSVELWVGYEDRRRSRLRVRLSDGQEAALRMPRGTVLREGDRVSNGDGTFVVSIRAADEMLSVARTADPHLLARAAYHLGNRHVPLQVHPASLSYEHDHVLDGLVRELGLVVTCEPAPFEPEAGGYRHLGTETGHGHGDGHEHGHGHGHGHGNENEHGHGDGHEHGHGHGAPLPHAIVALPDGNRR